MVNLTISESIIEIKMVNLLNQLQANCWCHTSPLMQYGCMTTFSQEKDDFSVNNTGCLEDWKLCIPNGSPTYDILVILLVQILLLHYRRLVGVEGTKPGPCTISKQQKHYFYEMQCTNCMYRAIHT